MATERLNDTLGRLSSNERAAAAKAMPDTFGAGGYPSPRSARVDPLSNRKKMTPRGGRAAAADDGALPPPSHEQIVHQHVRQRAPTCLCPSSEQHPTCLHSPRSRTCMPAIRTPVRPRTRHDTAPRHFISTWRPHTQRCLCAARVPSAADASSTQVEAMYKKEHDKWKNEAIRNVADDYELSHAAMADEKTLRKEMHEIAEHIETKYKLLQNAFRQFDGSRPRRSKSGPRASEPRLCSRAFRVRSSVRVVDRSGKLSPFELEQAVKHFNLPIPHEHIMQIAERCADEDGQIDYAHFCATLHEKDTDNPEYFLHGSHRAHALPLHGVHSSHGATLCAVQDLSARPEGRRIRPPRLPQGDHLEAPRPCRCAGECCCSQVGGGDAAWRPPSLRTPTRACAGSAQQRACPAGACAGARAQAAAQPTAQRSDE
jgi:hypothetical protein